MIGEIDDGWFVGGGTVLNVDGVVIGEGIHHFHIECSRKSLGAVGVDECELQAVAVLLGVPHLLVISLETTMQAVPVIVDGKGVFIAVESETSVANAVAVTAYQSAKVAVVGKVVGNAVVS